MEVFSLRTVPGKLSLCVDTRTPTDQTISRESSASPNLIGDQAAHPVCDH